MSVLQQDDRLICVAPVVAPNIFFRASPLCRLRLRRSEVLRSLRHYLRAHSQGHHTIEHICSSKCTVRLSL